MREPSIDTTKTALILGHFQNGIVNVTEPPGNMLTIRAKEAGVILNAAKVAAGMREARIPVIHIKVVRRPVEIERRPPFITDASLAGLPSIGKGSGLLEGTHEEAIVDELTPAPQDYVLNNYGKSAFYGSSLESILRRLGIDTLVVGGIATHAFLDTTVRDATDRDYNVIILSDCCMSATKEEHEHPMKVIFPRLGRVRTSDQVLALLDKTA